MRKYTFIFIALAISACSSPALTAKETEEALEESSIACQAEALTASSEELVVNTDFTIGEAVEKAAQKIKNFIASQLPCAEITVTGATLKVAYGALSGNCSYNGLTYSGSHMITVKRNEADEILVHHVWNDFSNGRINVDGRADVTWSLKEKSRRVVHELTWTRKSDGRTGTGSGDRTQTLLPGGLKEGIEINGAREWEGEKGEWHLDIDGIQIRWVDPAPQAGSYMLDTPFDGKSLRLSFQRISDTEIEVIAETGRRIFRFIVRKSGLISRTS